MIEKSLIAHWELHLKFNQPLHIIHHSYIKIMEIEDVIIAFLKVGLTQAQIAVKLKANGMHPNSLSSIEKTLKELRKKHGAKTMFHLGYILGY